MSRRFFSSKVIYKAKRGYIHDPDSPQYDCFRPVESGNYYIFDAWVCDDRGNVHPGYGNSPVPVTSDMLGEIVSDVEES